MIMTPTSIGEMPVRLSFADVTDRCSMSKGWRVMERQGKRALCASHGGNELYFDVVNSSHILMTMGREEYLWAHIFLNDDHVGTVNPGIGEIELDISLNPDARNTIRVLRTSASSGPCYEELALFEIGLDDGGCVVASDREIPSTVFTTFGDSISGNCCVRPSPPFDPYELGYGYDVCAHFGWQYFNTARDGSGLCRRDFDNPLAIERIPELVECNPDYLHIMYGTNDLGDDVPVDEFTEAFREMMKAVRDGLPSAGITCCGLILRTELKRDRIVEYNKVIEGICTDFKVPFRDPIDWLDESDLFDEIHPNEKGQKKIALNVIDFYENVYPGIAENNKVEQYETS
jgi:lysophospholipase L1-like esterase